MNKTMLAIGLALCAGCSNNAAAPDDGGGGDDGPPGPVAVLPGPSHGSPLTLSPDDSVAVVVNRDAGSVTVFALAYPSGAPPSLTQLAEIDLGAGSEPWQAVVSPSGTRAFVILRHDQKLIAIDDLNTAPKKGASVAVGSEPTGLALTPTGGRVWVANWVDGTALEIDPSNMSITKTIDLNAALVAAGPLGASVSAARPSLAHPRSIAITNNGDMNDADESVYVTEYFGQHLLAEDAAGSNADVSRKGIVYRIKLADYSVAAISLAPLADMGFKDHLNAAAGCYPNQLQSITINGKYAYVTSVCASPRGPTGPFTKGLAACVDATTCPAPAGVTALCTASVCTTNCAADADCEPNGGSCDLTSGKCKVNAVDVKTITAPVVSVIDTTTDTEFAGATASLNAQFAAMYAAANTPDDGTRRFPLFADDLAFVPGADVAYVSANGADAVFRVVYDSASGLIKQVGASTQPFINLNPAGITPASAAGKNPIGVAITAAHNGRNFGFAAGDVSRTLSVLDLDGQQVQGGAAAPVVTLTTALPAPGSDADHRNIGKRFFGTGVGRWSLKGQAWSACQSCHSDGLTDNVTWYFARGPRQSTSLDGTFSKKDASDQRVLNWTGIFDELADFENNTRGVSGGVGAIVSVNSAPPQVSDRIDIAGLGHSGLSGSAAQAADPTNPLGLAAPSVLTDWSNITAYVQAIRSPRAPANLDQTQVGAGRTLYEGANCQGCHAGDKWTISHLFYTPSVASTAALKAKAWSPPPGFPAALLPAATPANRLMRFGGANPAAFDQIQCILRPVGTFGAAESDVAANGAFPELRVDMTTPAQGNQTDGNGFNPPSLLGLNVGAPYLHHGGVRTLEALFSSSFAAHYQALAPNFLTDAEPTRSQKVAELIEFLLSIDGDAAIETAPLTAGASGGDFCAP